MQERTGRVWTAADGSRIWYRSLGQGPRTLVLCDGVGCAGYIWQYLIPYFSDQYRIIHAQYRGHGFSSVPVDLSTMSIEQFAADLAGVLRQEVPDGPLVLLGHSMGVQVALEFLRSYPAQVESLVLMNGPYGEALAHVHNTGIFAQALPTFLSLADRWQPYLRKFWRPLLDSEVSYLFGLIFEVNPFLTKRRDFRPYFKDLGTMDPPAFLAALSSATQHSAWDLLAKITIPVLLVASEKDRFTPFPVVKSMHEAIAGSELLTLPTASHIGPLELPELVNLRIEKFLAIQPHQQKDSTHARAKPKQKSRKI